MSVEITTDTERINYDYVHDYLCNHSYWAKGRTKEIVNKSIKGSLCFSVIKGNKQIGFARVISDFATYAYLADVFIESKYRGSGYSKQLMKNIMNHPDLQDVDRWMLLTSNAHGLYRRFGFKRTRKPNWVMEYLPFEKKQKGLMPMLKKMLKPKNN